MKKLISCLAAAAALAFAAASPAATLTHDYELNGSLADSHGGAALTALGGSVGATGYTFGAGQGLVYTGGFADIGDYSILMKFSLDDTGGGYAKIIDFLNRTSDDGLYAHSQGLEFKPFTGAWGPAVFDGRQSVDLLATRDAATGIFTAWIDGSPIIAFYASACCTVFRAPGGVANFFLDDTVTGGSEAANGFVDSIKIYDGAMTFGVPEPDSTILLLAGLGLLAWRARRARA